MGVYMRYMYIIKVMYFRSKVSETMYGIRARWFTMFHSDSCPLCAEYTKVMAHMHTHLV